VRKSLRAASSSGEVGDLAAISTPVGLGRRHTNVSHWLRARIALDLGGLECARMRCDGQRAIARLAPLAAVGAPSSCRSTSSA
jgi:hypothetical protein